ncbi:MAG TPA: indolepyruvate oxidoreductase subunit beta family protein, partial [Burkholderiaceae bacterium]|nr:indolepyruvate oxidoreductase subunit beta family protein [Burkholderiaceae bacterium]
MTPQRPITLLVCALGGEGGGVLAQWLVETALHCGYSAQASSIPGVAQRTGATTYYIEVFPRPDSELGGRKPIFSLAPVPGALDVLVSSELLETVRQVGNGMASPDRTQIISSRERTLTTAERLQPGDGRADTAELAAVLHTHGREAHLFDMTAVTLDAGTVMSAVLFGAVAACGALPFAREAYEAVIKAGGRGAEASLRGFARAFDIVAASRGRGVTTVAPAPAAAAREAEADTLDDGAPASAAALAPAIAQAFPAPTHRMLGLGIARLVDYQDGAYAKLYVERLGRVLQAEHAADPAGAHAFEATQTTARYLALWMAFDDVVRVADLKTRRSRFERVRRETKARDDELLRVYEHFKPGIPEVAAMLPAGLGNRIKRWDVARQQTGKPPVEFPLKIGTHTVFGFLALRMLAAVKPLRRHGTRFAAEQAFIERWLDTIVAGLCSDWSLGHEIAECGRLIKGYGSTNERGKGHLLHVIDHLASDAKTGAPP